ncbi:hypothetical protein DPEC_G00106750 [Dallia pectoralis]|uniref:Uncharacterized protein n=1 Tax=Dallia pectoralis TaxID=75939 RepID=A0ACC2GZ86_DALPE|nr:hypothetical protein DPEC_G00106750 [Dallia pectoralis]
MNILDGIGSLLVLYFWFSLITTGLSQTVVVGQKEPVVALVGDDVILPCSLSPSISAEDQTVEWQRTGLDPKEVHYYTDGRDQPDVQNPLYWERTSLFKEELRKGNMSLLLTGVKPTDAGYFTCFVPTLKSTVKKSVLKLIVGAVSQPVISIVVSKDYGVVLRCDSGGWYPEPEMIWLDSDGTVLPADGPTETGTDSEGLYNARGHVTVQKTDNNTFTCRVQQQKINHMMETQINVPGDLFQWSREAKAGLTICVLILLVILVAAVLAGLYFNMRRELTRKNADSARKNADSARKNADSARKNADSEPADCYLTNANVEPSDCYLMYSDCNLTV